MKLFRKKNNEREIAIEYARGLSDDKLKKFRKAVDLFREGDKFQAERYERGNAIIADNELEFELLEEKV